MLVAGLNTKRALWEGMWMRLGTGWCLADSKPGNEDFRPTATKVSVNKLNFMKTNSSCRATSLRACVANTLILVSEILSREPI